MATATLSVFLRRVTRAAGAGPLRHLPDDQLLERFLVQRDDSAFEVIVRRHGPMVLRVCWRALRQIQDAEDAFQATFLLLAHKVGAIRKRASLSSWLHGVAHRVSLKAQAQRLAKRRHEGQLVETQRRSLEEITWAELRPLLDEELQALPEKLRLPLILCYLEGKTQDEAAGVLKWSKCTFRRRLEEAREALRRRLARRGVALSAVLGAFLLSDCAASAALPAPGGFRRGSREPDRSRPSRNRPRFVKCSGVTGRTNESHVYGQVEGGRCRITSGGGAGLRDLCPCYQRACRPARAVEPG